MKNMDRVEVVRAVAANTARVLQTKGMSAHVHNETMDGKPWCWVTADAGWPDYRHAKIGVGIHTDGNRLWLGVRWDKGLTVNARGYIAEPRMLMDGPQWDWSRLTEELAGLEDASAKVNGPSPTLVQLGFGNGLLPGFRPFASHFPHQVEWTIQEGGLKLVHPVYDIGATQALQGVEHLGDALQILVAQTDWAWTWAMLKVGWVTALPRDAAAGASLGEERFIVWLEPVLAFVEGTRGDLQHA